jgi:peptidoglycan/xylan/chitin deacetylase (PgdA/CDA1 family)
VIDWRDRVYNITFHGVGPPNRSLEDGEGEVWITTRGFEAALDEVVGRSDVVISFDDGNQSDLTYALPRLIERQLTATFFVLAGLLDEPTRLTRQGVRELQAAGMSVGSHGWSHRSWRHLRGSAKTQELVDATALLEDLCQRPVRSAAIPFGLYGRSTLSKLRAAGMIKAFTSDGGPATRSAWLQPRSSIKSGMVASDVAKLVAPDPSPAMWAKRGVKRVVKRWR